MRILCVGNRYPPWSVGGYETTWAAAVDALRDRGHDVCVLTTRPDPTDRVGVGGGRPPGSTEICTGTGESTASRARPARVCRARARQRGVLRRPLRRVHPRRRHVVGDGRDVVVVAGTGPAGGARSRGGGRRRVGRLRPRGRRLEPALAGAGRLAAPAFERLVGVPTRLRLDLAGQWSFNSQYTLATARAAGPRLADASVDHPGVDPERFAAVPAASGWGWRLLCCGRIDPRKGIDTAVQALALLPRRGAADRARRG